MALTITVTTVTGENVEKKGTRFTQVLKLSVTGDNVLATQAMPTNWWKTYFPNFVRAIMLEPLSQSTPDKTKTHSFKFSSDGATLYISNDQANAVIPNAEVQTANFELVGY